MSLPALLMFWLTSSAIAAPSIDEVDANWHQWRGPRGNGTAPAADPPVTWSETENIRWKVAIPGESNATPIVWKDRIYVVSAVKTGRPGQKAAADSTAKTVPPEELYEFTVSCLDRSTGRTVWSRVARESVPREGRHDTNSYASASPVTDGKHLWVSFGSQGIYGFDLDGNRLWDRDLGEMRTRYGWGEGASPALHGDTLVVNWDAEENCFIVALDALTGEERWRQSRDEVTSWGTPTIVEHGGVSQVIVNGTRRVRSYDFKTGEVLWECGGQTTNAIPTPIVDGDSVYVTSGFQGSALMALPLGARGDITGSGSVLWSLGKGTPYVPSPVLVDRRLYFTAQNNGVLTCVDADSGKILFGPERIPGVSSLYASPLAAAGRIYFVARDGATTVIEAGATLNVLATNKLDEEIDSSPVAVGRQLFLRGDQHLYCIEAAPADAAKK